MLALRSTCALAVALVLGACGDDGSDADGGLVRDAGRSIDSGSSLADGAAPDAGAPDSGASDAAVTGACPSGECDLLTGAGCGEGEACYFATADGGALQPRCGLSGSGMDGDPCESLSDCASGYRCEPEEGACRHYCCGGSDADCPDGQVCAVTLTDVDGTPTEVGFCKDPDTCDLLTQEGCSDEMQACYPRGGDGVICIRPDEQMLTEDQECTYINDCSSGLGCFELTLMEETSNRCVRFCDVEAEPSTCREGQSCTSLGLEEPMENVGYCNPPMSE